jgi:signal transduction histidine kinase
MTLRNKLWGGFASLLVILVAVCSLTVAVFTSFSQTLQRVFRENYDSATYIQEMQRSLVTLDDRAQRTLWDAAGARAIDADAARMRFDQSLNSQLSNAYLPGELEQTRRLASLWKTYNDRYFEFEAASPDARPDLYRNSLLPRHAELEKVAQAIAEMNTAALVSVNGQARQILLNLKNAIFIMVVIGAVLAGAVLWTVTLTTFRPLKELTDSAHQIEQGNLDQKLDASSTDEIGHLSAAFNSMASHLREFKRIDTDRLTRTQQTTQLAIDSLADAVFVLGPDAKVEICNAAARAYFGIDPGKQLADLGLKWLGPLYHQVVSRQQPVNPAGYRSAVQLFLNGEEHFLLPKAVPMISDDRRQVGVAVILVDVTQLRRVDEAKSSLVSTVSHELRTPLTSQRLLLGLLLDTIGQSLPPNQHRMLVAAKADSDRLYRTIEDLLSISRIESGRAQFQLRPVAPDELVRSAVEPFRQLLGDKNIRLNASAPADLPRITADLSSISSALANLLSNAIKFSPAGGEIRLSVAAVNGAVEFTVADDGPGIPPEFRQRIFEKFFRVPSSSGPAGAGLGLAIAKEIVEAHGGGINVDCPESGGARFTIRLHGEQRS